MAVYRRREAGDDPDKPTGPWEVAVRAPGGKQVVRRLDPRTGERITGKRHAQDVERFLLGELHGGEHAEHPTATVREFARRWWRQHVMVRVKAETRPNYRLHLEQRILTTPVTLHGRQVPLGDVELGAIRVSMIDEWMANLAAAGDRAPTINRARAILSSMLGRAVKWEVINANPCAAADKVKETKRQRRYLTTPEVLALADATRNLRDRTMVIVGAFTGLRPSELLGLTIEHVHLTGTPPSLHVEWQLAEAIVRKGKVVTPPRLTTPKDYETGTIELPAIAREALAEYLAAGAPHPRIVDPNGRTLRLVFAKADGDPLALRTWRRSSFGPACVRAGLAEPVVDAAGRPVMTKAIEGRRKAQPKQRPLVSPNDLRHFYPSFLRSLTPPASPEAVCARMRHHDPSFTMRTYGDLFAADFAPVLEAMDAALASA